MPYERVVLRRTRLPRRVTDSVSYPDTGTRITIHLFLSSQPRKNPMAETSRQSADRPSEKNKTTKPASVKEGRTRFISAALLLFVGFIFLLDQYRWHISESPLPVVEFIAAVNGDPPEPLEQQSVEPIFLTLNGLHIILMRLIYHCARASIACSIFAFHVLTRFVTGQRLQNT